MHHSHLEYLIAVQKLQGEEMGAQGAKIAEEMGVTAQYIMKLTKTAEQKGYIRRGKARSVYITEHGKTAIRGYLLAAQAMEQLLVLGGVPKQEIEHDAGSVGAGRETDSPGKLNFFAVWFLYANRKVTE